MLAPSALADGQGSPESPAAWVVDDGVAALSFSATGEPALVVHSLALAGLHVTWPGEWVTPAESVLIPLEVPSAALVDPALTEHTVLLHSRVETPSGPHRLESLPLRLAQVGDTVVVQVLPKVESDEFLDPAVAYNIRNTVIEYHDRLSEERVDVVLTALDLVTDTVTP